jgi:ribosome biogenesis GTPase
MTLQELGYTSRLERYKMEHLPEHLAVGRVLAAHKERYTVGTGEGSFEAEVTGHMRFTAGSREDFPAVGDWVSLMVYGSGLAIIHGILPRDTVIKRQLPGHAGEAQVIAANVDYAFIVQSADRDFNLNRTERYLTLCHESGVAPVIVLTKTDLVDEQAVTGACESLRERIPGIPVLPVSNETRQGLRELAAHMEPGKTYCLLGSSGVGKSTLLNLLAGGDLMRTGATSLSTSKGRHTTSHRELFVLPSGGILIDNPGMREVGIADAGGGLDRTFDRILHLSEECRYKDCTHTSEAGCAVLQAVETGDLDPDAYENFLKLAREKAHFETSAAERRRKERQFGKILRDYQKKDVKQRKK